MCTFEHGQNYRITFLVSAAESLAGTKVTGNTLTMLAGIMDCFVRVAKCQGILSFWRGNLANVRLSSAN